MNLTKRKDGYYQLRENFIIDGKKVQKSFYGKTEKIVKAKRDEFLSQQKPDTVLLGTIVKRYMESEKTRISADSYRTKEARLNAFEPLYNTKLVEITPRAVSLIINELAVENPRTKKPTAKRTLKRYVDALSNVFEYAEAERLCTYNPCKYIKIPTDAPQKQREALSRAEYMQILEMDDKAYIAPKMMIMLGLRRGELAALTVDDIDLNINMISITKSYDFKDGKLKPPKTSAGVRDVPIPSKLRKPLQSLCEGKKGTSLVITNQRGRRMTETNWTDLDEKLVKALGFKFTWHQLRHTYATILYDAGVDVLTAQKYLGHSSPRVTLEIYTHLSEQKKKQSTDKLDSFLG